MFELHSQLHKDTVRIGSFPLCEVLLLNDSQYPWVILVPRREGLTEIYQMTEADQQQFLKESGFLAAKMQVHFQADKMNIAALGNVVSQLHIHHIARYKVDAAWPKPVWGVHPAIAYTDEELSATLASLQALLMGAWVD